MKTLPGKARQLALRAEFNADHGFCVYCQRTYKSPNGWWNHLLAEHPGTYRTDGVKKAMETAA